MENYLRELITSMMGQVFRQYGYRIYEQKLPAPLEITSCLRAPNKVSDDAV